MVVVDAVTALSESSMPFKIWIPNHLLWSVLILFDHPLTSVQSPGLDSSQWFWYHLSVSNSISILKFIFAIFSKWIIFHFFAQLIVKCVSVVTSHCHWIRDQPNVFSVIVVNDFPTLSDSHWFKMSKFRNFFFEIAFSEFGFISILFYSFFYHKPIYSPSKS